MFNELNCVNTLCSESGVINVPEFPFHICAVDVAFAQNQSIVFLVYVHAVAIASINDPFIVLKR